MENISKYIDDITFGEGDITKNTLDNTKSRVLSLDNILDKVSELEESGDNLFEKVENKIINLSNKLDLIDIGIINDNVGFQDKIFNLRGILKDLYGDLIKYKNSNDEEKKNILFSSNEFITDNNIVIDNTEGYFENGDFLLNIKKYINKPYFNELMGLVSLDVVTYYEKHGDLISKMQYNPELKDIYDKFLSEDKLMESALLKNNNHSIIELIGVYKKYLSNNKVKHLLLSLNDNQFFGTDYIKDIDDYRNDNNIDLYKEIFGIDFIKSDRFKNILLKSIKKSNGDFNSYNITDILRIKDKCGFTNDFLIQIANIEPKLMLSNFIFKIGDLNLVREVFPTAVQSDILEAQKRKNNILERKYKGYKSFLNNRNKQHELLDLYNEFIPKSVVINNLDNNKLIENKELLDIYSKEISDKSLICRDGRFVNLGSDYNKLKKHFTVDKEFENFIEKQLLVKTVDISQSINDIYDFYEEKQGDYNYVLDRIKRYKKEGRNTKRLEDKINYFKKELGSKLPIDIKKEIKKGLKNYSTEEIISALGNHVTNYSTTFKLMLNELDGRFSNGENIITFIESNDNLNQETKEFLIGQTLVGLLARGKTDKMNNLINSISSKKILGKIIGDIINYKNNDLFSEESFSGLLIGLTNLLEKNDFIKNKIKEIYNSNINKKFNLGLYTVLRISDKKELLKEIVGDDYSTGDLNDKYKGLIKYAEFPNDIHEKFKEGKTNDIVMVYGGGGTGGGTERYSSEINKFKNLGYSIIKSGNDINILEKDGVKMSFINYDELDIDNINNLSEYLSIEGIDSKLVVYRGHNYYTSMMIEKSKGYGKDNVIIDGGCRNISKLATYRKQGIDNQVLAYDSTGQGDDTLGVVTQYIKYIRDVRKKPEIQQEIKTWDNFKQNYGGSDYAKKHIKFPGSMIDILGRIGSE